MKSIKDWREERIEEIVNDVLFMIGPLGYLRFLNEDEKDEVLSSELDFDVALKYIDKFEALIEEQPVSIFDIIELEWDKTEWIDKNKLLGKEGG